MQRQPFGTGPAAELLRGRLASLLLASFLCLLLGVPASAESGSGSFDGRFLVGYRLVDNGGSETKYREDLNLEDGPRLFDLSFDYQAPDSMRGLDLLQLDLQNFGGDPFETLRLAARKHGRYQLDYRRTKSDYFYADTILPLSLAQPSLSNGGDLHTFDFERVRDTASFAFRLNPRSKLNLGFERYTKRGESTTTLDIQRDEFEMDRPIDESYQNLRLALELSWDWATLILQEEVREFDNAVEVFLPGRSLGENPEDSTTLDFFFLDQPYELDSVQHTVRLNASPGDRWLLQASASLLDLELDAEASERSEGVDFRGLPFTTNLEGGGEIERDSQLLDLDLTYLLRDHIAIVGGLRRHQLDQEGTFNFGDETNVGDWDIETIAAEAGLEVNLSSQLTVSGGARWEERDVESGHGEGSQTVDEYSTEHLGFFANLAWRPSTALRLDVEVEDSSYDEPFTLSSPSDRQRWRLRGRYRWENGCFLEGSYLAYRFENEDTGWNSDRDQLQLRGGWRREDLDLAFGYSRIESDRDINQSVTTNPGFMGGITFLYPILYSSEADLVDGRARWRPNPRWTFGADLRLYDNEGSFAHRRQDLRAYVEHSMDNGLLLRVGYRDLDYDEDTVDFDDHDAQITELAIGYAW